MEYWQFKEGCLLLKFDTCEAFGNNKISFIFFINMLDINNKLEKFTKLWMFWVINKIIIEFLNIVLVNLKIKAKYFPRNRKVLLEHAAIILLQEGSINKIITGGKFKKKQYIYIDWKDLPRNPLITQKKSSNFTEEKPCRYHLNQDQVNITSNKTFLY